MSGEVQKFQDCDARMVRKCKFAALSQFRENGGAPTNDKASGSNRIQLNATI
jgi:hypothetical protein